MRDSISLGADSQTKLDPCPGCGKHLTENGLLCYECEVAERVVELHHRPWRRASSVEREEVHWAWYPRIPRGKVTLVGGDPGVGKSLFTMALAANVSIGRALPDTRGAPLFGSVLLASFEDGPGDTILPRLENQGADTDKIYLLDQWVDEENRPRPFRHSDVPVLEEQLGVIPDAVLLVVDPIMAFVGGKTDTNKDNEVRECLDYLTAMAHRTGIAVVVVAHLNKSELLTNALFRISGSVAFVAVPRSVLLVGMQQSSGRRGIAHTKSSLSAKAGVLEFTIDQGGAFRFGMVTNTLAQEDLISSASGRRPSPAGDEAEEDIRRELANGPLPALDVLALVEDGRYSEKTLRRAADRIGVIKEQVKEGWIWSLNRNGSTPED